MRHAKAIALVIVAACGGSQDKKQTIEKEEVTDPTEADPVVKEEPPPPPPPEPLTTEERVAFHDGCFADFVAEKPDFFERCYSEQSTDELIDSGMPAASGVAGIKEANTPFWAAFTLEGEVRLNLANGENVVTIGTLRGTHDGDFMGMPPSGKTWGLLGAEVQNLDDQGRHGNVRGYFDLAQMMAHLGQAPKGMKFRKAAALTGAPPITVIATDSDVEAANVAVVQTGFDAFNAHDWKTIGSFYAADAVISDQMMAADTKGKKAIDKMYKEMGKAFPDAKEEISAIWGAGDYVVVETTFSGTNKAAAPGMGIKKATKKAVSLRTAHVFKLENTKVKEHWIFGNGMAMAIQLGLIKPPPPPKAAEPAAEE